MAIIIFCSHLCIGEKIPLEPKEWTDFAGILLANNIQPCDVLKYNQADFTDKLEFSPLRRKDMSCLFPEAQV